MRQYDVERSRLYTSLTRAANRSFESANIYSVLNYSIPRALAREQNDNEVTIVDPSSVRRYHDRAMAVRQIQTSNPPINSTKQSSACASTSKARSKTPGPSPSRSRASSSLKKRPQQTAENAYPRQ